MASIKIFNRTPFRIDSANCIIPKARLHVWIRGKYCPFIKQEAVKFVINQQNMKKAAVITDKYNRLLGRYPKFLKEQEYNNNKAMEVKKRIINVCPKFATMDDFENYKNQIVNDNAMPRNRPASHSAMACSLNALTQICASRKTDKTSKKFCSPHWLSKQIMKKKMQKSKDMVTVRKRNAACVEKTNENLELKKYIEEMDKFGSLQGLKKELAQKNSNYMKLRNSHLGKKIRAHKFPSKYYARKSGAAKPIEDTASQNKPSNAALAAFISNEKNQGNPITVTEPRPVYTLSYTPLAQTLDM